MNQFIVKVPGSEYALDEVLQMIINTSCKIVSISIAGGGFIGGSIVTYIVVEGVDPGIETACRNHMSSYKKTYEMPIIDNLLKNNDIDKKEYEKRVKKLMSPIEGVEVMEAYN